MYETENKVDRLPLTDELLKKEVYANKCDELAEDEAVNYDRHWGRWYLSDGMLSTWVCTPKIGVHVVQKLFEYQHLLDDLKSQKDRDEFIELMSSKEWMGESGLKKLKQTLKSLFKKDMS
jgi:hypothetical protein